jgi:hypothetical protein
MPRAMSQLQAQIMMKVGKIDNRIDLVMHDTL